MTQPGGLVQATPSGSATPPTTITVKPDAMQGWVRFTDRTGGFSIAAPGGWKDETTKSLEHAPPYVRRLVRIALDPSDGTERFLNVTVQPLRPGVRLDEFATLQLQDLKRSRPGVEVQTARSRLFTAGNAVVFTWRWGAPDSLQDVAQFLFVNGRRGYLVSFGGPHSMAEVDTALATALVKSLRLAG